MPYFHLIDYVTWIGSSIVEVLVLCIMLRCGLTSRFPIFFSSLAFDFLRELALPMVVHHSELAYRYAYWLSLPIEYVIGFGVMLEAFRCSLDGDAKIPPQSIRLLALAAVVLVGLATYLVLCPDIPMNVTGVVLTLDRSIDLLRCGMFLFLVTFAARLGLCWRHHIWGIVLGFGVYAIMGLIAAAIHATTGVVSGDWVTHIPQFGYLSATIIWAGYLRRPEPARKPMTLEELSVVHSLLGKYRRMLAQLWRLFLDGITD
jgi:hypothetical protein